MSIFTVIAFFASLDSKGRFCSFCFRRPLTATFSEEDGFQVISLNRDKVHCVAGSAVDPDPDSMGSLDPYPDPDSLSGSTTAKMTHKHRK